MSTLKLGILDLQGSFYGRNLVQIYQTYKHIPNSGAPARGKGAKSSGLDPFHAAVLHGCSAVIVLCFQEEDCGLSAVSLWPAALLISQLTAETEKADVSFCSTLYLLEVCDMLALEELL